jgi:hypothetical protein
MSPEDSPNFDVTSTQPGHHDAAPTVVASPISGRLWGLHTALTLAILAGAYAVCGGYNVDDINRGRGALSGNGFVEVLFDVVFLVAEPNSQPPDNAVVYRSRLAHQRQHFSPEVRARLEPICAPPAGTPEVVRTYRFHWLTGPCFDQGNAALDALERERRARWVPYIWLSYAALGLWLGSSAIWVRGLIRNRR